MLRKCISIIPRLSSSLVPAPGRLHSLLAHFSFATSNTPNPKKTTPEASNLNDQAQQCQPQCSPDNYEQYVNLFLLQDKLVHTDGLRPELFQEMDDSSKMYFLKVTALFFLVNVMVRLMLKREKHFKSYERHI